MTLMQFCNKRKLPDDFNINRIPVNHPETGEKIYLVSGWNTGFWYRKKPGVDEGRVWPCQYTGGIGSLQVHRDARREVPPGSYRRR